MITKIKTANETAEGRNRPAISFSVIAELSALYEISSLAFSDNEQDFAREAVDKATRLFGARYFALLAGSTENPHIVATWGMKTLEDVLEKIQEKTPSQFVAVFNHGNHESVTVVVEQANPIQDRERRLFTIFARRLDNVLTSIRNASQLEKTRSALAPQLAFEATVLKISKQALRVPAAKVDSMICAALQTVGEFTRAHRCYLCLFKHGKTVPEKFQWCSQGTVPHLKKLLDALPKDLPWLRAELDRGNIVRLVSPDEWSTAAGAEKAFFKEMRTQALLLFPLKTGDHLKGFIGLESVKASHLWSEHDLALLHLTSEILIGAIQNRS